MGNQVKKYLQTRKKLQWFFEQAACGELHSAPIEAVGGSDPRKRQGRALGRLNDVARIRWALDRLLTPEGLPAGGKRLRLTHRMMEHVIAEFTGKRGAVEALYGYTEDSQRMRYKGDCYRQTLNIALARIEAAFYGVGIFGNSGVRRIGGDYKRTALGYLKFGKRGK